MSSAASIQYLRISAWFVTGLTVFLAVLAWGQEFQWHVNSTYIVFPVLGLVAFSIMWSHYLASVLRQCLKLDKAVLKSYFDSTAWAVLILICLHPGLLIYQRFRDGYGLPPHSYESYVAPGLGWVTLLGSASLLVFLAYELRRWYHNRPWWKYLNVLVDLAMLAIFYHGLRLGSQTQSGWYHGLWWFYGVTLVLMLIYQYILNTSGTSSRSEKTAPGECARGG